MNPRLVLATAGASWLSSGTLERLLTTPMAKLDLLGGYGLAFAAVAAVQVALAVLVSLGLGLSVAGSIVWLLVVGLLNALLGLALGLLASAYARSEFQALQFMPVVVLPQLLLCGLFHPRDDMATALRWASDAVPLSYAVDALQRATASSSLSSTYWHDLAVVLGCTVARLALAAATLRRRTDSLPATGGLLRFRDARTMTAPPGMDEPCGHRASRIRSENPNLYPERKGATLLR